MNKINLAATGLIIAALVLVCGCVYQNIATNEQIKELTSDERESIALRYVSQTHGIPEGQLIVIDWRGCYQNDEYGKHNRKLLCARILDAKSGNAYDVFMDDYGNIADEKEVELDKGLVESETKEHAQELHTKRYGKLEPVLYDRLQEMQSDEWIKVAIEPTPISSNIEVQILIDLKNKPEWDTYKVYSEIYKAKEDAYRSKERILTDYLTAKGFDIIRVSNTSHLIFVKLTREEVIATEKRDDVDIIYLSETREPETSEPMILPKGTSIPFVNIAQKFFDSGYKEKTQKFFVVTNQTELGALPSLGIRVGINLSDYFIIVAFHGHRSYGGSRIDIVNITQSDDEIRVMIGTSEWWGAPVDAEVSPYQVVAVEKSDLTKKGRIGFVFFDMSGRKLDEIEKSIS